MPELTVCLTCGQLTTNPQRCDNCQGATPKRIRTTPPPPWKKEYGTARWKQIKQLIQERDDYTCYKCGKPSSTADHLKPLAQCGKHWYEWFYRWDNLAAICDRCNKRKGATTDKERHTQ